MEQRGSRLVGTLVVLAGIGLDAGGNLAGNRVAMAAPPAWVRYAPLALGLVVLAEFGVAVVLGHVQSFASEQDPRRRSRARRSATMLLIILAEVLAALLGTVSNVASGSLSTILALPAVPFLVAVTGLVALISVFLYLRQSAPPVEATNRRNFLSNLHTRYSRRQEDALRGAVLIALGLEEEPEAVAQPTLALGTLTGQNARAGARQMPAGTQVGQVYDGAGGHLLILGEPGAGKTTLLVALGLELLGRARADARSTLPVLFNLSTWAIDRLPVGEWMIEDLVNTYQVPRAVAQAWVATDAVSPLLDGLDEVESARRADCVQAINTFQAAHPQLPLVVCSRSAEYRAQAVHLALESAVIVQPLTDEQITAYPAYGGESLAALRAAVETDPDLRAVLRTPLLLRLVTLTYQDLPRQAIPPVGDHDAWRRQLLQEYVARMLARARKGEETPRYAPEAVERYLAWLARQMRAHGLVEFYLERMQPD